MTQLVFVRGAQANKDMPANLNANFNEVYTAAATLQNARVVLAVDAQVAAGTFVVPAGYRVTSIDFFNTTANAVSGGIKIGTTLGGTDVVAAQAVGANAILSVSDAATLKRVFSTTVNTTLYLDAVTAWAGASVNVRLTLAKTF